MSAPAAGAAADAGGVPAAAGRRRALPGGYHTALGERALRLSAGQRQKMARAFLRDAPLLLLDEPAAHLDPASARQLARAIETALAGRTVIVVSHGRGWAGGADRVIRLDQGRLLPPTRPASVSPAVLLGLLTASIAVPFAVVAASGHAERATAGALGELGTTLTDLLCGAAELQAFGAKDTALDAARAADRKLTALTRRSAVAAGVGSGLTIAVPGVTLWGVLVLGVTAVAEGTLTRVPLAVVTLTSLAAFEAATVLPAAALQLGAARASATRIATVLDVAEPVADPPDPMRGVSTPNCHKRLTRFPRPTGARGSDAANSIDVPPMLLEPHRCSVDAVAGGRGLAELAARSDGVDARMRGVQVRYRPGGPLALDGLDFDLPPGRRVALVGRSGAGKSTVAAVLLRFCDPVGGTGHPLCGTHLPGMTTPGNERSRVARWLPHADVAG